MTQERDWRRRCDKQDFMEQVIAAGFADVCFDNVGGDILDLVMGRIAMK